MLTIRNIVIYIAALAIIISVFFTVSYFYTPQGIGEVSFDVDYNRILALSLGIFIGAVSSQIYDRYVKSQEINAMRSDFLIGALASTILTAFLFNQILSIDNIEVIFFFAFQNGFLFTTVIEKFKSRKDSGQ